MIISASRRTDIPAFFSDWFFNRIKEGYLLVRNPMNIHQISRINILPNVVDCIVFWSKNPTRMFKRLDELINYDYYFQFTITGYGKKLEPNVINLKRTIDSFKYLSEKIGNKKVIWRYDPIIFTNEYDYEYHINMFHSIAKTLAGKTKKCVISFIDLYKKSVKNMYPNKLSEISNNNILEISRILSDISAKYDIELATCAEEIDLMKFGISHGKCIDDKLIYEAFGTQLKIKKDKYQRDECGCVASIDIGAYNTCPHGCLYCYANYDLNQVRNNYRTHDSKSALLLGKVEPNDKITDRKVLSCKILQQSFFK